LAARTQRFALVQPVISLVQVNGFFFPADVSLIDAALIDAALIDGFLTDCHIGDSPKG